MYKTWTPEEDKLLVELKEAGLTREAIAAQLGRTLASSNSRIRNLIQLGSIENKTSWSLEEEELLIKLRDIGVENSEIAGKLGRSVYSVKGKVKKLIKSGKAESRLRGKSEYAYWSDEDLLKEVAKAVSKSNAPIQLPHVIDVRFGSWGAAQKLAKVVPKGSGYLDENKLTRLYLIRFYTGVYKVGITQQTVKKRFSGTKNASYEIIDLLETDLFNACYLEIECLKAVKKYQFIAEEELRGTEGKTECFIPPHPIHSLEEIFDL